MTFGEVQMLPGILRLSGISLYSNIAFFYIIQVDPAEKPQKATPYPKCTLIDRPTLLKSIAFRYCKLKTPLLLLL